MPLHLEPVLNLPYPTGLAIVKRSCYYFHDSASFYLCYNSFVGLHIDIRSFNKPRRKLKRTFPTGTVFFTGVQGAGKSLSATRRIYQLKRKYPNVYIYSNIKLSIADKVVKSEDVGDYILDRIISGEPCQKCKTCKENKENALNDPEYFFDACPVGQVERPIIFFIDEIHTVFSNPKVKVSPVILGAIRQQRKALKTIIGTLQDYMELSIDYRRDAHVREVVECSHLGPFQLELSRSGQGQKLDRNTNQYIGRIFNVALWKRHNFFYDLYDSYEIINQSIHIDQTIKASYTKRVDSGSMPLNKQ